MVGVLSATVMARLLRLDHRFGINAFLLGAVLYFAFAGLVVSVMFIAAATTNKKVLGKVERE